jgi:hypothetical protein
MSKAQLPSTFDTAIQFDLGNGGQVGQKNNVIGHGGGIPRLGFFGLRVNVDLLVGVLMARDLDPKVEVRMGLLPLGEVVVQHRPQGGQY